MKLESFCKDAGELYVIAVRLAGFDALEVMLEINKIQRNHQHKISTPTIEQALQNIRERYLTPEDKLKRQKAYSNLMNRK